MVLRKIKNRGFTLIEMIVSLVIFSLIIGAVIGVFSSSIQSQRKTLSAQELLDQTSYALEYMSRSLRMARKELSSPPACLSQRGLNYETTTITNIKFIDYSNVCTEFLLETGQIKKRTGTETWLLTSPKFQVSRFRVNLSGQAQTIDNLQPSVTLFLEIQGKAQSSIKIQTTISQRNLDETY